LLLLSLQILRNLKSRMSDNEYEDYGEYEEYENNDYGGDENMDQPAE
jgi:hypothetical protein